MSQRKLQQEIERTFKKVNEGMEEFDYIYEKLQDSDNPSQKDKLESDLKKEIKKLQRHRDQIKSWMSGNDVKDKKELVEYRHAIEREMERFKEVEKVMKTKAFSNEGLANSDSLTLDPRQKEKAKCVEFLEENIEELNRQAETLEAEVDRLSGTSKKKRGKDVQQEQEEVEERLAKHRFHIDKLESVMRRLVNDKLKVDLVNDIHDDIEYYVQSNDDPNFIEDDDFYEELGLDEPEDSILEQDDDDDYDDTGYGGLSSSKESSKEPEVAAVPTSKESAGKHDHTASVPPPGPAATTRSKKDRIDRDGSSTPQPVSRVSSHVRTTASRASSASLSEPTPHSTPSGPTLASQLHSVAGGPSAAAVLGAGLKPATPVGTPKMKYAAVASAALHQQEHREKQQPQQPQQQQQHVSPRKKEMPTGPASTRELHSSTPTGPSGRRNGTPTPGPSSIPIANATAAASRSSSATAANTSNNTGSITTGSSNGNTGASVSSSSAAAAQTSTVDPLTFIDSSQLKNLPEGFEKYIDALDKVRERVIDAKTKPLEDGANKKDGSQTLYDLKLPPFEKIFPQLESSLLNCPDSYDADTPKNYLPTNQFVTQPCFPQEPAVEITGSTKLLKKLELDTLAYCFYYHNQKYKSSYTNVHNLEKSRDDDYLQYITARELHNRDWKYDKQEHTWFHDNSDEKEPQLGWKFFDYKSSWMPRHKPEQQFNQSHEERAYY